MKPPYHVTGLMLRLIVSIAEKIGEINARYMDRPSPQLRKQNEIRTIHASLQIEGNILSEDQITALLENKRVIGPPKDIAEVVNAIAVYDRLSTFVATSEMSFLTAHKMLMNGLIADAGSYRKQGVGIVKGADIQHLAPPAANVPYLMKDLFAYLKNKDEPALIKSCVFHYETEFIHPFMDGNGRIGRLWQTIILLEAYPIFAILPLETLISNDQDSYYKALSDSDNAGKSTAFIEYMLGIIDESLTDLVKTSRTLTSTERLAYFTNLGRTEFTRKDYMAVFKEISSATASRDLAKGVALGLFAKSGDKKMTLYKLT